MKCAVCRRDIRRGAEEQKRVEYHLVGGEEKIFGHQMPDGPLSAATGPLLRVIHSKHYWANTKAEARGRTQFGHAGQHHGTGAPDCPRELHHHEDEFCTPPGEER